MKRDVGKAVDILSDILLNSKLEERAIERERDVILREMEEVRRWGECSFAIHHIAAAQLCWGVASRSSSTAAPGGVCGLLSDYSCCAAALSCSRGVVRLPGSSSKATAAV